MAVTLDNLRNVHQTLLSTLLESIFQGDQILVNTKKKTDLKYPTGAYMEFDIWVPNHNLCFEFQDAYHYVTTWYYHNDQAYIQHKDYMKRLSAREKGMTLVTIPCWWDGNLDSLLETILFHYPYINSTRNPGTLPIPLNPSTDNLNVSEIPTVGELMLASFPTDPEFSLSIDDNNWWLGEKYDGIRCCWHKEHKIVYSRQQKELTLLPQLMVTLPSVFVDGELWFGRGNFSNSYIFIKAVSDLVQWHSLRMVSFDNPAMNIHHEAFETRYQSLLENINLNHPFVILATRAKSNNFEQISKAVQAIIDGEGEGVILRKCGSRYVHGRSSDLIKLKAAQGDQEGIIVGIGEDKSIDVKLPNGKTFTVPPTHVTVGAGEPLRVGDIVSFMYESNARREVPVNAVIYRVRTDIEWEDVVVNVLNERRFLNDSSAVPGFTSHPLYHWNLKNMRLFLESFAKSRQLDPLTPETWYTISSSEIRELKDGASVLRKFSSYFEAIETLFPELDLDLTTYKLYNWDSEAKRRSFFTNYAMVNDFDPLVPDNWYAQPRDKIMAYKGATQVISFYNRRVADALLSLFPDIGLRRDKFYWPKWVNSVAKMFFENYANENRFDPLNADNWYSQPTSKIMEYRGALAALLPFNGSIRKALSNVFPDIGFDKARFASATYATPESRRKFFENYALEHNFDPQVPEKWYEQSFSKILAIEGATKVIAYHSGSVARALLELFPDIGLDKQQFYYKSIWSYPRNRREFFENYAQQNGFDPRDVDKWYTQPKEKILNFKGASRILCYHGNNIAKALVELFPNYGFDKSKFILTPIWQDARNRRLFFEDYARAKGFDHLIPDNWYTRSDDLLAIKEVKKLLVYHSDSLAKALLELFPDVKFDKKMFNARYRIDELVNRKKFFETFARDNNFDPLVASNWYSQSRSKIMVTQGATKVMSFYNNSISKALLDLFPNIGLDEMQFIVREMHHARNRRKLFENYAARQGFDPYSAENWYFQSKKDILAIKDIELVLVHHKNSIKRALLDLFPSIGFDASKFQFKASPWNDVETRRQFFINYAIAHGFDPRNANYWYSVPKHKLIAYQGATRVMWYHNNSITQALYDLFPDIGLDPFKLRLPKAHKQATIQFFTNYAHTHHFDPLNAENWYSQPIQRISSTKGAKQILIAYSNSVVPALQQAFPEIGLDSSKFRVAKSKWSTEESRREFFISIAKENGLDPLVPQNWYSIDKVTVMQHKGIISVLSYHNDNLTKALLDLFPDIGLKRQFFQQPRLLWSNVKNRREFFETYAKENGFDYTVPDNWYLQPIENILAFKGGKRVVSYHNNSVEQAIIDLFPNIGLDKSKFKLVSQWSERAERRRIFESYAEAHSFDPYIPENWYKQSMETIKAYKGATHVLLYYQNNVIRALSDLFPHVHFDAHKFANKGAWQNISNQREFFENYAMSVGFDPLQAYHWYLQSFDDIMATAGAKRVMSNYNNSISKALVTVFPDIIFKGSLFRASSL